MFFSKAGLTRTVREGRWFFAEAPNAFVAVCVVDGDAAFSEEASTINGQWLVCENKDTPVILEARKVANRTLKALKRSASGRSRNPSAWKIPCSYYRSLGGDTLELFCRQITPPGDQRQTQWSSRRTKSMTAPSCNPIGTAEW